MTPFGIYPALTRVIIASFIRFGHKVIHSNVDELTSKNSVQDDTYLLKPHFVHCKSSETFSLWYSCGSGSGRVN